MVEVGSLSWFRDNFWEEFASPCVGYICLYSTLLFCRGKTSVSLLATVSIYLLKRRNSWTGLNVSEFLPPHLPQSQQICDNSNLTVKFDEAIQSSQRKHY
jgi:hypothetical protein